MVRQTLFTWFSKGSRGQKNCTKRDADDNNRASMTMNEHVLCTYSSYVSARTPWCLGKSARFRGDSVERCTRTSLALVHCHRRLFIIIGISFSATFLPTSKFCHLGFFSENRTIRLTYFSFIASYCFIFDICLKWKSPLRTSSRGTNRGHLDALIGWEFFCLLLRFELPSVPSFCNLGF